MVGASPPSVSRPSSRGEMYNSMMGGGMSIPGMSQAPVQPTQPFAPSSAPTRYTSNGSSKYAPAQTYGNAGMPAAEPQRPSSSRYAPAPSGMASLGVPGMRPEGSRASSEYGGSYAPNSRRGSAQETSSQGSYEPRPILSNDNSAYSYSPPVLARPDMQPPQIPESLSRLNGLSDQGPPPTSGSDEMSPDAETGGYAPPAQASGYEPPSYSYTPYEPEPDSPVDTKPKSKPKRFGDDDDDDDFPRPAATAPQKSQADRAADEAFRKAAEADAARDNEKAAAEKKGWFGWFGGKKDPNAAPGPVRAKLGEESSFYYDNDLGKWVNKKGGADAALPAAPTPPPPRAPASRVTSMGPPSGPPSRASSGTGPMPNNRPPTSGSGPGVSGPQSGPPSRVGTPASVMSDAPMGVAPPLPLNGVEGSGPPSRPPTSLSTASSIDDLLAGPPGARKGGTLKGKKKGGRYVDVMAK